MPQKVIFDKKNVLVTGGAGFIGSHLCDELVKTSKVICLDNFSSGDEKNIDHLLAEENFRFLKHDIAEPLDLEAFSELNDFKIAFQGIQEIYNLACPMSPKDFEKSRVETILANTTGLINMLNLARHYEAAFLHFSSSVVYGPRRADNQKIAEDDIGAVDFLSPRAGYDEGKRYAETMVKTYGEVYGLSAKIIRLFRIYGPRMKLIDNQMIPDIINNALDGADVEIIGDRNFSTSLCYVSDAVDAAIKMMSSGRSRPVNIGSDVLLNMTDVAEKIIRLIGSNSQIKYAPAHLFMTPLCLPDITLAKNLLGWMPVVTLEKGLEKTIDDLRASKNLIGPVNY